MQKSIRGKKTMAMITVTRNKRNYGIRYIKIKTVILVTQLTTTGLEEVLRKFLVLRRYSLTGRSLKGGRLLL